MADDPQGDPRIEVIIDSSNVDRLSSKAVHDSLVKLVDRLGTESTDLLRANVPKGETNRLERAVSHGHTIDADLIEVHVGIPAIPEARDVIQFTKSIFAGGRGADPALYPIFEDQGTTERHPLPPLKRMKWDDHGRTIFARKAAPIRAQHFMAKTFAETIASMPGQVEMFKADVYAGEAK